jgi:RNA polymerase sigma factor (sigma-70 family)
MLESKGLSPDDIYEEKNYILWVCICNFNPDKKTKFSTWLGNYARYTCYNSFNKKKIIVEHDQEKVKEFLSGQKQYNDYQENSIDFENLYFYLKQIKNKRQKEIVKLRYFSSEKMTWKEIAKKMNISVQTCITSHNECLSNLRTRIKTKDNL